MAGMDGVGEASVTSIEPEYRRRLAAALAEYAKSGARAQTWLLGAVCTFGVLGWTVWKLIVAATSVSWSAVALLALVATLVLWHRASRQTLRAARLVEFYEHALGRVDGSRTQSGLTGEALAEAGHLYARDLDVLGPDSLFGLLATTRTGLGDRALAAMLLHPVSAAEARGRQAAVQELSPLLDLREQVALLGWSGAQLPAEAFERWLAGPERVYARLAPWMRWALVAITAVWTGTLLASLVLHVETGVLLRNVAALLAVQGAFCLWLQPRVAVELELTQRLAQQVDVLQAGMQMLRKRPFACTLLAGLVPQAEQAKAELTKLARSLMLVEQRAKEWYYAPALLLAVGTHAAISLSTWRARNADAMRSWTEAWGSFEALLAMSAYAAEHEGQPYPEVVDSTFAGVNAEGMWHPLLPSDVAVANDLRLGEGVRFLLISGSNMAGKSTLLRALGANVVLALAGAPVCAKAMRLSALHVGASLAVVDSLAEGKSKFLAEVERLRDLVELSARHPGGVLFLIDEVLSGTNSVDRRATAEVVVRGLLAHGAIGALSTHDLLLAEIADMPELRGRNVHMASPSEHDPLSFDYLLKDGVNRTTNALAIVRMLGLGAEANV